MLFRLSLRYLKNQGYQSIGLLTGEEKTTDFQEIIPDSRRRAYRNFCTKEGIYDAKLILIENFSALSGYELIKAKLETEEKLPDAFFVASDSLAIGALRAFQEASLIVPDQIQIISFNDTIMERQVFPPLSYVTVYTEEMGRTAMDVLNKQVLTPREIPILTMLGTKLTLRGSMK